MNRMPIGLFTALVGAGGTPVGVVIGSVTTARRSARNTRTVEDRTLEGIDAGELLTTLGAHISQCTLLDSELRSSVHSPHSSPSLRHPAEQAVEGGAVPAESGC